MAEVGRQRRMALWQSQVRAALRVSGDQVVPGSRSCKLTRTAARVIIIMTLRTGGKWTDWRRRDWRADNH